MKGTVTTYIPGELESLASDGVVASSGAIFDYNQEKSLEEINEGVKNKIQQIELDLTDLNLNQYGTSISYDNNTLSIQLKNGDNVLSSFSAADFIKDEMITGVEIKDVVIDNVTTKCLSITFNTDAGGQAINIPLYQIFNSNDYYTKLDINSMNLVNSSTLSDNYYSKLLIDNMNLVSSTTLGNTCYTKLEINTKLEENELIVASALNSLKADIDIIKQLLLS